MRAESAPTSAMGRAGQRWESFTERLQGGEGMSPRRVVIVIVMVCFLSLALASPVRTYFTQRGDAAEAAAHHQELVAQISELQKQQKQLEDPDYIRAKARDRLGFVEAGKTPYIVELPGNPEQAKADYDHAKAASQ
ncbi:MAG: septum formation initiator family protein, partial [Tomitella sp.]|nr:septum formation initiator family protein [Tomitella sp.]